MSRRWEGGVGFCGCAVEVSGVLICWGRAPAGPRGRGRKGLDGTAPPRGPVQSGVRHVRIPRSAAAEAEDLRDRLEAAGADALDTADCLAFTVRRGAGPQSAGWAQQLLPEVAG